MIVVPCFNEAERLDRAAFVRFAESGAARVLYVNDGSRDDTEGMLQELVAATPDDAELLSLEHNRGKAEAVRQGLLHAIDGGARVVGYLDADLSTPVSELVRLLARLDDRDDVKVVMGARVALLGRDIQRRAHRHYLGRVFSTVASFILDLSVYDTQCGAKVFVADEALRAALDEPFLSRWAFDVELIGRLMAGGAGADPLPQSAFVEVPLREWRDVGGSKLGLGAMTRVAGDLALIERDLRRRRRGR